ncbi:MAG: primosomal protein N', partial [Alphaproteobacteria bacterium]|nr:primosomal protein N' [Alphaproteobacteria bacterium]
MQQSNIKQGFLLPNVAPRVQVLVPYPVVRAYDYMVPEGMILSIGDYVKVSLGKKDTIGVVWSLAGDKKFDPAKLKSIQQKYTCPSMQEVQKQFIEWVAHYTMADRGAVLKMSISVPDAFQPPKTVQAYTLPDNMPDKISSNRKKVLGFLSDSVPRRAVDIAKQVGCSSSIIRAMASSEQLKSVPLSTPAPC